MTELRKVLRSAFDGVESRAFRRVDIAWLAAFRVLFGLTMCVGMLRFIANGWIDRQFLETRFQFKYWGFGWVERLPPDAMHALFWVLAALALAVAVGFRFRTSSLLFTLGFVYLELVDVTNYLNHYYLAALLSLLLTLSPANRAFSIDVLLAPKLREATVPLLWHDLFRFQVGIVYVFAGLAKAHADWLVHAAPLRIWLSSNTDVPVLGALFAQPWAPVAMSWAGFLFDSTVVAWLLVRCTRPYAYAAVIVFHMITGVHVSDRNVSGDHDRLGARVLRRRLAAPVSSTLARRSRRTRRLRGATTRRMAESGACRSRRLLPRRAPLALALLGLRWRRSLARTGHAFFVARDGPREKRQHHLHGPKQDDRSHLAGRAQSLPHSAPRTTAFRPTRSDSPARPPRSRRLRASRARARRGARRCVGLAQRATTGAAHRSIGRSRNRPRRNRSCELDSAGPNRAPAPPSADLTGTRGERPTRVVASVLYVMAPRPRWHRSFPNEGGRRN